MPPVASQPVAEDDLSASGDVTDELPAEQVAIVSFAAPLSASGDVTDELPADLDATLVGPYRFPDNSRRRITGSMYLLFAAATGLTVLLVGTDGPLLNGGIAAGAVALAVVGAYHLVSGRRLRVDEHQALVVANGAVEFAVGHASAQLGWRGWLSRPTWRVLVFSSENPPQYRALVLVDGSTPTVLDSFVVEETADELAEASTNGAVGASTPAEGTPDGGQPDV